MLYVCVWVSLHTCCLACFLYFLGGIQELDGGVKSQEIQDELRGKCSLSVAVLLHSKNNW